MVFFVCGDSGIHSRGNIMVRLGIFSFFHPESCRNSMKFSRRQTQSRHLSEREMSVLIPFGGLKTDPEFADCWIKCWRRSSNLS